MTSTVWSIDDALDSDLRISTPQSKLPITTSLIAVTTSLAVHLLIILGLYAYSTQNKALAPETNTGTPIKITLITRSLTDSVTAIEPVLPEPILLSEDSGITPAIERPTDNGASHDLVQQNKPHTDVLDEPDPVPQQRMSLPSFRDIQALVTENAESYLTQPCEREDDVKKRFDDCERSNNTPDYDEASRNLVAEFYQGSINVSLVKPADPLGQVFTGFTDSGNGSQLQHQINSRDATYKMMVRVFGYP